MNASFKTQLNNHLKTFTLPAETYTAAGVKHLTLESDWTKSEVALSSTHRSVSAQCILGNLTIVSFFPSSLAGALEDKKR